MTTGSAAAQILPATLTVSVSLPASTTSKVKWPVAEVVTEYSCLPSAAKSLMIALSTRLPAESRRTPLQEGGGEEWSKKLRGNARTSKKACASERDQERIEETLYLC